MAGWFKSGLRQLVQPNLGLRPRPGFPGEFLRERVAQRISPTTQVITVGPKAPLTPVTSDEE